MGILRILLNLTFLLIFIFSSLNTSFAQGSYRYGSSYTSGAQTPRAVITGSSGVQAAWPHPGHERRLDAMNYKSRQRARRNSKNNASRLSSPSGLDKINQRSSSAIISEDAHDFWHKVLFYIPNRVFDLVDVFRLDAGLGSSGGAVIRATRHGQIGYRYVEPSSYRLGLRGRDFPFFVERSSEYGIGYDFEQSPNRHITPYEIGIGADIILVGAYAGLSLDELWDFITGWVLIDNKNDDL